MHSGNPCGVPAAPRPHVSHTELLERERCAQDLGGHPVGTQEMEGMELREPEGVPPWARKNPASAEVEAGKSFQRAGDRTRTGDVQLGKLAFYQLNYAREGLASEPAVGIEPTTARLRIECSTTELLWRPSAIRLHALARTRTATPCGTTPSRWRVYQFHHQGNADGAPGAHILDHLLRATTERG